MQPIYENMMKGNHKKCGGKSTEKKEHLQIVHCTKAVWNDKKITYLF